MEVLPQCPLLFLVHHQLQPRRAARDEHVARLAQTPTTSLLTSGEKLYSPAALAKVLKVPGHRGGAHLNGSTIFRFVTKGKMVNGQLIRLDAASRLATAG